ncbi:MAG TPA: hypothetical protein VND93_03650 [Myxococcales bacterium]|nr:hypothetical protein [Myxococcales bacterium]
MCFRLLAAVDPPLPAEELSALAVERGLDVRASPEARFAEIAWGDCACSLYTRREGRLRAVALVEALLERGRALQLLLLSDGEEIRWTSSDPVPLPLGSFQRDGLQALPEGQVAQLR